jgi:hypothetical protein
MIGSAIGGYHILAPLGEGGMGAVYRARQDRLGREVALKVLRPGAVADLEGRRRFHREMQLAAQLSHPNLVKIFDGGSADDLVYIAMELVARMTPATSRSAHGGGWSPTYCPASRRRRSCTTGAPAPRRPRSGAASAWLEAHPQERLGQLVLGWAALLHADPRERARRLGRARALARFHATSGVWILRELAALERRRR